MNGKLSALTMFGILAIIALFMAGLYFFPNLFWPNKTPSISEKKDDVSKRYDKSSIDDHSKNSDKSVTLADLRRELLSKNRRRRKRAVEALIKRGPTKEVIQLLAIAIQDQDDGIQSTAKNALYKLGPKALPTAPILMRCIEDNQSCSSWAALVLGNIGPSALPEIELLARSKNKTSRQRAAYALALMRCHGSEVKRVLKHLAKDKDSRARRVAKQALVDMRRCK